MAERISSADALVVRLTVFFCMSKCRFAPLSISSMACEMALLQWAQVISGTVSSSMTDLGK